LSSSEENIREGDLITERLRRDFNLIVEMLRMASTAKDYVHDELLRCDDVGCVAEALYRVGRRYYSDTGLKALFRRVAGLYKGGSATIFQNCAEEAKSDVEKLADEVWRTRYAPAAGLWGKQVSDLLKWLEEILSSNDGEKFKKVLTILATISLTPGYLYLPRRCLGGKGGESSG